MIKPKQIEIIQQSYKAGYLSAKESVNLLTTLIIKNKYYFGLEKLNDDSLFDFAFYICQKIENCLNTFEENRASFSSYLQNLVRLEFLSWKKLQIRKSLRNQAILNYNTQIYNFTEEESFDDGTITVAENNTNAMKKFKLKAKDADLYVIILKAIYYITPDQTEKLITEFKLDSNQLYYYMIKAREAIKPKVEKIKRLQELSNRDFIRREEIKIGLEKFEYDSPLYRSYAEELEKINIRFRNRKIKLKTMKAIPSDKTIGNILGIPSSTVRYILTKNFRNFNIEKIDE
ncbi:MAG: hypothetical protein K5839_02200 [Treponemataceae bacterium]|nr:hypothetical protein [Treponemataceae bacterium]